MLVKVILKPAINLAKRQEIFKKPTSVNTPQPSDPPKAGSFSSGSASSLVPPDSDDYENEDFIQVQHERSLHEGLLLEMNMN